MVVTIETIILSTLFCVSANGQWVNVDADESDDDHLPPNVTTSDGSTSPPVGGRIVGGNVAQPGQFPYQALIYAFHPPDGRVVSVCGGSLIRNSVILTAAHCVDNKPIRIRISLGTNQAPPPAGSGVTILGDRYIIHERWDTNGLRNDIALVHLSSPAPLSGTIKLINTATDPRNLYENQQGTAIGWGSLGNNRPNDGRLRYVTSRITPARECAGNDNTKICLSAENGKSVCSGDSGGPLVSNNVLVGIASYVVNGCEGGFPSVFTRVSAYVDWIRRNFA